MEILSRLRFYAKLESVRQASVGNLHLFGDQISSTHVDSLAIGLMLYSKWYWLLAQKQHIAFKVRL